MKLRNLAKVVLGGFMIYDALSGNKSGMNGPSCTNRTKCNGLKKNGQLRKGYKFLPGGAIKKV